MKTLRTLRAATDTTRGWWTPAPQPTGSSTESAVADQCCGYAAEPGGLTGAEARRIAGDLDQASHVVGMTPSPNSSPGRSCTSSTSSTASRCKERNKPRTVDPLPPASAIPHLAEGHGGPFTDRDVPRRTARAPPRLSVKRCALQPSLRDCPTAEPECQVFSGAVQCRARSIRPVKVGGLEAPSLNVDAEVCARRPR